MSQDGAHGRYTGHALAGGRYQLRDLLGEGGMASVHLAYDSVLDRQVAIKEMRLDGMEAEDARVRRERSLREARATARITCSCPSVAAALWQAKAPSTLPRPIAAIF